MAAHTHGRATPYRDLVTALKESPLFNSGLVWSAFLVSRFLLLFVQLVLLPTSLDCDVRIYARYANAYALASARDASVYDYCQPEYPHLALVVMALPRSLMNAPPAETAGDVAGLAQYRGLYRIEMALFDFVAFLTVLGLVHQTFREESRWRRTRRLLLFVGGGLLLGTLVYTRMDIALGTLVVLSLALLIGRRHYAWSFVVLAVAINFKLVPVVLIPLWVVASLPATLVGGVRDKGGLWRLLGVGAWRTAVAGALTVALSVPAYLSSGGRSLGFFAYHKERGLEIGSLYSSALLLLRPFGWPEEFGFAFGCLNLDAPGAPLLARLSPIVTLSLVTFATVLSCRILLRLKFEESRGTPTNAGSAAGNLAGCTALVLAAFMAGNKVFSPQYLLWLVPLVPLLPLATWYRRLCTLAFVAACLFSTATLVVWQRHVVGDEDWIDTATSVSGPTALGTALLIARNMAFVGLIVALGFGLVRMTPAQTTGGWRFPLRSLRTFLARRTGVAG